MLLRLLRIAYKILKQGTQIIYPFLSKAITVVDFYLNGVDFSFDFRTNGKPIINVNLKGEMILGKHLDLNNGTHANMIGRQQRCYFIVGKDAKLEIGDNVGISSTAIVCQKSIIIRNNVRIGGNCVIYDTDFHSLDPLDRNKTTEDVERAKRKPVLIMDNAFVGAHSTILKGVTIGENSVIGACSVVTKNVPSNEMWGGNPAKLIRIIKT